MYLGRAYQRAVAAVETFTQTRPDIPIALHIASAGYGILGADDLIVPYEAAMGATRREWTARGARLAMPERVTELVESCDAMIAALSQPYYVACGLSSLEPRRGLFAAIGTGDPPRSPEGRHVLAGRRQARALATTEREIASVVLARLLNWIGADGMGLLADLPADPLDWPAP